MGPETLAGRWRSELERAVLVGVDLTRAEPRGRAVNNRAGAAGARRAVVCSAASLASAGELLGDGAAPEIP
jgi:hypothetical protein